jgi:GDP-L-fucose synthase
MDLKAKIFVAGHRGLVGSAITRRLRSLGYDNLLLRTRGELDLLDTAAVRAFFYAENPVFVCLAAARVGGIAANAAAPADFFYENSMIANNVVHAAYMSGVRKLLFLGSSCIYPKEAPQPIREEYLLSGPLEVTNEGYAIAKIAGLKMCQYYKQQYGADFISCMPTNLYGPGDNFDLQSSHVMPALIRKIVEAKESGAPSVEIWGSGRPLREFLYVDDLADACVFLMERYDGAGHVNVGTGKDISIADLAQMIQDIVGYSGQLVFNPDMPDGTYRKLLDVSKLSALGWTAATPLCDGVEKTVRWFLENRSPSGG